MDHQLGPLLCRAFSPHGVRFFLGQAPSAPQLLLFSAHFGSMSLSSCQFLSKWVCSLSSPWTGHYLESALFNILSFVLFPSHTVIHVLTDPMYPGPWGRRVSCEAHDPAVVTRSSASPALWWRFLSTVQAEPWARPRFLSCWLAVPTETEVAWQGLACPLPPCA